MKGLRLTAYRNLSVFKIPGRFERRINQLKTKSDLFVNGLRFFCEINLFLRNLPLSS